MAADAEKLLIAVILANRHHQNPARRKPLHKGRRDLCRCSGDDHSIVRRLLGPTLCPVTESANGVAQQLAMPLDREHPAAKACEDRSLIPRTGAYLERIVPLAEL